MPAAMTLKFTVSYSKKSLELTSFNHKVIFVFFHTVLCKGTRWTAEIAFVITATDRFLTLQNLLEEKMNC